MLYNSDCLSIIKEEIKSQSIDLIYLDPPFNTGRNFIEFDDRWNRGEILNNIIRGLEIETTFFEHIKYLFSDNINILCYIGYITERLLEFHRILKPTGSLYLHCDPRISHYLKIVLDLIFDPKNFQNEIIWTYRTGGSSKKKLASKHDIIFFYTKDYNKKYTFNMIKEKIYPQHTNEPAGTGWHHPIKVDEYGREYRETNIRDIWDDISTLSQTDKERTGYPTQKPVKLIERILYLSSNKGDMILDPFCGSGTTLQAAQNLDRNWIGIDINPNAIEMCKKRLENKQYTLNY